jgi:catalase
MLQGRLFLYGDAQRYRLGVNQHLIPVNVPRCKVNSYHRDGAMRVNGNHGSTLGYEPNSFDEWQQQPAFAEPLLAFQGAAPKEIKIRHTGKYLKAHKAYGKGVADALGIKLSEIK